MLFNKIAAIVALLFAIALIGRAPPGQAAVIEMTYMHVDVSAYSSTPEETWGDPYIAAWGDSVGPNTIAVSRDLLEHLAPGQEVYLFLNGAEYPPETLIVNDKMPSQWTKKIDIWHPSRGSAKKFGTRKEVKLRWLSSSKQ